MDDVIKLISKSFSQNDLAQHSENETSREVFAEIRTAGQSEWAAAALDGFRAEFVAITPLCNYEGEDTAEWRGKRYSVYRTYVPKDSDMIELHLRAKAGVTHGRH